MTVLLNRRCSRRDMAAIGDPPKLSERRRGGFSLLGVVLASGMTLLVVLGAVGLLGATRQANARTEQRIVATFLAREGIELVRAVRDRNWFDTQPAGCPETGVCTIFWRGRPGSAAGEICDGFSRIEERSIDTDGLVDVSNPETSDATRLFRRGAQYEHDHSLEADWVLTPYRRWIEIGPALAPFTPAAVSACGVAATFQRTPPPASPNIAPAPFTVHAFVRWGDGAGEIVQLTEELYPWMNYRPFPGP